MKKINIFIALLIILIFTAPKFIFAAPLSLTIDAKSAVIMEASSGEIIFEQNADERLSPASVTKVMTMLLIYEAIHQNKIKWDDMVQTSAYAASMGGSQIFLEVGEMQSVRDLTKSIVIASANDAAVAMAEFISGSEESFVDLMNKKAVELGMDSTSFKNSCGLDSDGHFTTAKDIAIMSRELITKYPEYQEFATTWMDKIIHKTNKGETEFGLTNTNKLIKQYNGTTGLKTGSTSKALYCLSATANRNDMDLIAVIMAAPDPATRFQEAMKMLDYGYANFKLVKGELSGSVVAMVPISKDKFDEAAAMVENLISNVTEKGANSELEKEIILKENLTAPIEKNAILGEIVYKYEGVEIGRSNLIAEETIERIGFVDTIYKLWNIWLK